MPAERPTIGTEERRWTIYFCRTCGAIALNETCMRSSAHGGGWRQADPVEVVPATERDSLAKRVRGREASEIARARGLAEAIAACPDDVRLDGLREVAAEIVLLLSPTDDTREDRYGDETKDAEHPDQADTRPGKTYPCTHGQTVVCTICGFGEGER